jgi:hypothetical protein
MLITAKFWVHLSNVQVAKLLQGEIAGAPVNRSFVVIEEWFATIDVHKESKIRNKVV